MSWEAQGWAVKQKTGSGTNKCVLICLSQYADEFHKCFPSIQKLCKDTEYGASTVRRALQELERLEFICIEPRFVSNKSNNKRQTSNLYTLNVGCHIESPNRIDTPPPTTEKDHIINHKEYNVGDARKSKKNILDVYTEDFLEFWNNYPRKDGSKRKAFELFLRICARDMNKSDLMNLCIIFRKQSQNTHKKYIPHCTTWLAQRRWETINNKEIDMKPNKNQLAG